MKLLFPAIFGVFFASGLCCCGGILEKLGVPLPGMNAAPSELSAFAPYPGATYVVGAAVNNIATANYELEGGKVKDIVGHYKKQAVSAGYSPGMEYADDTTATMQATKGAEKFTATATMQGSKAVIVIALEK